MTTIETMFVASVRTMTSSRMNMIRRATSMIVFVLLSVIIEVRSINITENIAVTGLCVNFDQVIVVVSLRVSTTAESTVDV